MDTAVKCGTPVSDSSLAKLCYLVLSSPEGYFCILWGFFLFVCFNILMVPNLARSFSLSSGVAYAKNTLFATIRFASTFSILPLSPGIYLCVHTMHLGSIWFGFSGFRWAPCCLHCRSCSAGACFNQPPGPLSLGCLFQEAASGGEQKKLSCLMPVSYTHLTLPTNTLGCRSRWSPYH